MNRWKSWGSYLVDVLLVTLFAGLGRTTHHDEIFGPWGAELGKTAWPFVLAVSAGWLALRAWRNPLAPLRVGGALWLGTLTLGLALRWLSGGGLALPFVLVASASLAVLLIGWRLIARLLVRGRAAATS